MRALSLFFLLVLPFGSTAYAQDDDNPFDDALEEDEDDLEFDRGDPQPQPAPREPDFEEPEDDPDYEDPTNEDGTQPDILGDDPLSNTGLGNDTAELYRQTLASVQDLGPDEEMQVWDAYLAQYPNTAFRPQIEKRLEDLENAMYDLNRIRPRTDPDGPVDADKAELKFSQGLLIENINPRRRVQLMLQWGLPDFASLAFNYEHPISRKVSFHGGVRRRFLGMSIEAGSRIALVKSARTQTLVTFIGDVHVNASPAFFGIRPQLAFGKRLGKLDLQGQAGIDYVPRAELDMKIIGGLNATYRASDAVAAFFETSVFMGNKSGAFGLYRFNQVTFGMKFFPARKKKDPEDLEINVGASVPYTNAYWQYHFGSLVGQANFYLD